MEGHFSDLLFLSTRFVVLVFAPGSGCCGAIASVVGTVEKSVSCTASLIGHIGRNIKNVGSDEDEDDEKGGVEKDLYISQFGGDCSSSKVVILVEEGLITNVV